MPFDRRNLASCLVFAAAAAAVLVTLAGSAAQATSWKSGTRTTSTTTATAFATWRGTNLGVVSGWVNWKNGWTGMYNYASGSNPRRLRSQSSNVSLAHGLFPKGGTLSACASGQYDDEQRNVAKRLAANGVGDAEIRLGWEANGDWFPWKAAGVSADQWKTCFTKVAKAMKAAAPNLRICWSMGKKGRVDVRTLWPNGAPITNICLSHYDDAYARFGYETYKGGPWGLRAWLTFAAQQGQEARDRGVGRGPQRRRPRLHPEHARLPQGSRQRHRARSVLQHLDLSPLPDRIAPEIDRTLSQVVLAPLRRAQSWSDRLDVAAVQTCVPLDRACFAPRQPAKRRFAPLPDHRRQPPPIRPEGRPSGDGRGRRKRLRIVVGGPLGWGPVLLAAARLEGVDDARGATRRSPTRQALGWLLGTKGLITARWASDSQNSLFVSIPLPRQMRATGWGLHALPPTRSGSVTRVEKRSTVCRLQGSVYRVFTRV